MSSENLDSDTQVDYEDEKQDSQEKNANPVKAEEAKLKAKYPGLNHKPGGSDFLMKRLQKGVGALWCLFLIPTEDTCLCETPEL
ncbi:putative alpha-endosulfine-like [Scophthalmus maximus]|uniref:Putative alpha-endosulfine-like n=1 Tax=Scophthalmus maximus TaxID=52904 RepID=A0A2U9CGN4_SCOMX|nr:putative alpha-endosulfine-like [Scophthalmus maximus]